MKYSRSIKTPGVSAQQLYEHISNDIDRFLGKMDSAPIGKIEIDRQPSARTVAVVSKLFSANLICREEQIDLEVKLSFFAIPFKSKLDAGIDQWLAKRLGIQTKQS